MTGLQTALVEFVATVTQAVVVIGVVGVAVVFAYLVMRGTLGKP